MGSFWAALVALHFLAAVLLALCSALAVASA
jgi:hypothetical protein